MLCGSQAFAQGDPISAAVFNLEGENVNDELTSTLSSIVRNEAQQLDKYQVVNKFEINFRDILLVLGCSSQSSPCLKQAAEQVNARVLIFGRVANESGEYEIALRIFDSETGRMLNEMARTIPDTDDPVVAFRKEIESFFGKEKSVPTTRVRIGSNVNDAAIIIEGTNVGTVPLERKGLPPGQYEVAVTHPDYEPWETVLRLTDGADVELWAPLKKKAIPVAQAQKAASSDTKVETRPVDVRDGLTDDDRVGSVNWGAWSAITVGGLALVGSGVMAILMVNTESQIDDESSNGSLTESRYNDLVDQGESFELGHRILLGVGAVGLISGIVWLMIDDGSSEPGALRIGPTGPNEIGASLSW